MGRDKGKGRGGGGGRGSGKRMFIANIEELEMRNAQTEEHKEIRAKRREEEGAGGGKEESSSDEEEGEEKEKPKAKTEDATVFQRMSRAELAAKEGRAPAEEERPRGGAVSNNPNKPIQSEKMIKVKNVNATETPVDPDAGMNRKQREVIAAEKKKEEAIQRYCRGETAEARIDLERLAIVRQRRTEAAALRAKDGRAPGWVPPEESSDSDSDSDDEGPKKGPKKVKEVKEALPDPNAKGGNAAKALSLAEAKKAEIAAKKKAAAEGGAVEAEVVVLTSMDIKKMNGDALKEHLKERGLGVQGQKKDLMKRLCDFEAAKEAEA